MKFIRTNAVLSVCLAASAVVAQSTAPTPKLRDVCAADFQKLCPDVQPGHGAIGQCLKGHIAELSSDCKSGLIAHREAARARKSAMADAPATDPMSATPPK